MSTVSGHRVLALAALLLGVLAAVARSPHSPPAGVVDAARVVAEIAAEKDHLTALALAQWIRERKPRLRVIDVRPQADFEAFHIPTAESVPLDSLTPSRFSGGETLVLYSGGGTHGGQAWVLLRAAGVRDVFFLSGGVNEWLEEVMNPAPGAEGTFEAGEFARIAELSRYFGGTPRVSGGQPQASEPVKKTAATPARRRGC